jgi:hypothetical protein
MMVVIGFVGFGKRQSDLGRVGEKKMRFGGERVCDGGWCWRMRGHMGLIGWF